MDAMDQGRNADILKEAKKRGCTTTLDVFASTQDDLPLIKPLLANTDFFMPSEEEAAALSGLSDFEDIASFLLDHGVGAVILTLGANGAMYRDAKGNKIDIPSYAIDVVCTCGCGDCFNAGFATGLHLGKSIEDCIRMGQATSAQNAMGLDLDTTLSFMAKTRTRDYVVK